MDYINTQRVVYIILRFTEYVAAFSNQLEAQRFCDDRNSAFTPMYPGDTHIIYTVIREPIRDVFLG